MQKLPKFITIIAVVLVTIASMTDVAGCGNGTACSTVVDCPPLGDCPYATACEGSDPLKGVLGTCVYPYGCNPEPI